MATPGGTAGQTSRGTAPTQIIGQVREFDPSRDTWNEYVEVLGHFLSLNKITAEAEKRSVLLTSCGPETYHVVRGLVQPLTPSDKTFAELCKLVQDHYSPRPSEIVERYKFNTRVRESGETVQTYLAELRRLSEHCNFGNTLDAMLRDRIVCGINNASIQKKLLSESNLTLQKAISEALAMEAASRDFGDIRKGGGGNGDNVNYVTKTKAPRTANKKREGKKASREQTREPKDPCWRCGGTHSARKCKFKDEKCYNCQQRGHTGKRCAAVKKWREQQQQHYVAEDPSSEEEEEVDEETVPQARLYSLDNKDVSVKPFTVSVLIKDENLIFEVDTGSAVTIVSEDVYVGLGENVEDLQPCKTKLRTYTGAYVKVLGETLVNVRVNGVEKEAPLMIVREKGPNLLGRDWLKLFPGLVQDLHYQTSESEKLSKILKKHEDVFKDGLGTLKGVKAKIHVEENAKPVFCKARSVAYSLKEKVDRELDRLLEQGSIEPVKFSEWATPIVPVLKPNGEVRLCGDYKVTVNKVSHLEQYPIPKIEDLMATLGGGKTFTKLDLSHAYNQIELDDESSSMLTINTHRGLFKVNRLAYGISSAPAIFQRTLEGLVKDIPNVIVYLDDLLITGETEEAHLETLEKVLSRLEEAGLRLKSEKCSFQSREVEYLGHRIDAEGIHPLAEKVKAIQEVPKPKNVQELQAYLGLLNYYHRFLPDVSTVLAPLHELLKKGHVWRWGTRQQEAFEESKKLLHSNQVLIHYDAKLPLVLSCDASGVGLGAVLSHILPDGTERPVSMASRSLSNAERNYSSIDREACAIMFGLRKFHKYLFGRRFKIITDHKPLIYLMSEKKGIPDVHSTRMLRWIIELSAYEYSIEHKSGKMHLNADALSRLPVDNPSPQRKSEENVFLMQQLDSTPISSAQVRDWTSKNPILSQVKSFVLSGWPEYLENSEFKPFFKRRNELSVEDGCILWGARVVIPPEGREKMLDELHEAHPGMTRMKGLARGYMWWPHMDDDIEGKVKSCSQCLEHQREPSKAPIHPWEMPNKAWSRIHIDYAGPFEGKMILVVIDAYSKWIEAELVSGSTSQITIDRLRHIFAAQGLPDTVVSDNAACFTSKEFQDFLTSNGIRHVAGAPFHPSTNGLAEKAVQIVKSGLRKVKGSSLQERLDKFLFSYRLTPQTTTELAPCELLNKRRLRSRLDLIRPNVHAKLTKRQEEKVMGSQKNVRSFQENDSVIVRNYANGPKWLKGVVLAVDGSLMYTIELESGKIVKRHVDQIKSCVFEQGVGEQGHVLQDVRPSDNPVPMLESSENVPGQSSVVDEQKDVVLDNDSDVENSSDSDTAKVCSPQREMYSSDGRRVSTRVKRVPARFEDYVLDK